jgi:uncharacterized membrane protein
VTVSEAETEIRRLVGELRSLRIEVEQLHEQLGDLRDDLRKLAAPKDKKP